MRRPVAYGPDLAYVHDVGYARFAQAAAPAVLALLERADVHRGHVVELGCGAGAATRLLAAAGHDVLGIDASPAMIERARRNVPQARFAVGRLPGVSLPACDAVVAISEVMNYLATRSDVGRVFRSVHRALRPGGLFVFDVREPGRTPAGGGVRGSVGSDWAVLASSTERAGRLTRRIATFRRVGRRYRRSDEVHRLTLVPARDLAAALARAGFRARVARRYGAERLPPGFAVLVARKPGRPIRSRAPSSGRHRSGAIFRAT